MDSNFFNYISHQLPDDEVDIWFRMNNIIPEKLELFNDFCDSLFDKIDETYLGGNSSYESRIYLSDEDNINHFDWCWKQTLIDFEKERINFNPSGEHYDYLKSFFIETFYNQKEEKIKKSIKSFLNQLFALDTKYTKSDLDMLYSIYKSMDKNMLII